MATVWAIILAVKQYAALITAFLGFARQVEDTVQSERDIAAGHDAGRAETEAAQAKEGNRVETAIATEAAKPVSEDDAIARMRRGEA